MWRTNELQYPHMTLWFPSSLRLPELLSLQSNESFNGPLLLIAGCFFVAAPPSEGAKCSNFSQQLGCTLCMLLLCSYCPIPNVVYVFHFSFFPLFDDLLDFVLRIKAQFCLLENIISNQGLALPFFPPVRAAFFFSFLSWFFAPPGLTSCFAHCYY